MDISTILAEAKTTISDFKDQNPDGTVIIWWATATGKTKLSVLLSDFFDIEVISSDSRQIFRKMDIWTDKISKEIREKIPHHQIDIVNPNETYTAWERKETTDQLINQILAKGKTPFIVGGTWLYIDTIYKNFSMPECAPDYTLRADLEKKEAEKPGFLHEQLKAIDPEEAQKLHPNSTRYLIRALEIFYLTGKTKTEGYIQQPVSHPLLMLGLRRDKESTNQLINQRIKQMFKDGLIDEVEGLLKEGYSPNLQSMQGIWYKEVVNYLNGDYGREKMEELLKRNTHHLQKNKGLGLEDILLRGFKHPKLEFNTKFGNYKKEKSDFSFLFIYKIKLSHQFLLYIWRNSTSWCNKLLPITRSLMLSQLQIIRWATKMTISSNLSDSISNSTLSSLLSIVI